MRKANGINPNVEEQSVRNAIENGALSWTMIEDQSKEVVVERLRAIDDLDDDQCNELFEKLDRMIPTDPETKRREHILEVRTQFYEDWVMKCMYGVFECSQYRFICLCHKVSLHHVGGEDVLQNIKRDVLEMFENVLSDSINQMCFCKTPLERFVVERDKRPAGDWICKSCFACQSGRVAFFCFNDQCIFQSVTECPGYMICSSCFYREDNCVRGDESDQKEEVNQNTFVGNKVIQMLSIIGIFNFCLCHHNTIHLSN